MKLLVVGTGSIGERHVRCFQRTGRVAVAICEPRAALRQEVAGRYGIAEAWESLDAALQTPPDAAVLCTPAHLHVPLATRLAAAGVHLLIEKPLSTSLDGLAQLRQVLARQQRRAAVAYVHRAHPALSALRAAVRGGTLGRPVQLVATCGQHFPTYRPAYRDIYYRDRATGGGAVQDALTHAVNAAEWLVGPLHRLVADTAHLVLAGVEVEDTVHVLARHGELLAAYSLNQHQAPNEFTLTVVGERGTGRFEAHRDRWRCLHEPGGPWRDETVPDWDRDRQFQRQAEQFLAVVRGDDEPLCSLDEAEQTLRVNLAILASAASGRWESVHPPGGRCLP